MLLILDKHYHHEHIQIIHDLLDEIGIVFLRNPLIKDDAVATTKLLNTSLKLGLSKISILAYENGILENYLEQDYNVVQIKSDDYFVAGVCHEGRKKFIESFQISNK